MSLFPKRLSFKLVIWMIGILMALAISGWPLIYETYVRYAWQRIPCLVPNSATRQDAPASSPTRFLFVFNDKVYVCGRRNFWTTANVDCFLGASSALPEPPNDFCYIDGATPPTAVLRVDAYKHPADGIGHFVASGMVLAVCAFITFRSRRSASAPQSRS
jgi:hypothetical protein